MQSHNPLVEKNHYPFIQDEVRGGNRTDPDSYSRVLTAIFLTCLPRS